MKNIDSSSKAGGPKACRAAADTVLAPRDGRGLSLAEARASRRSLGQPPIISGTGVQRAFADGVRSGKSHPKERGGKLPGEAPEV
jgi:hypothetical protein